MCHCAKFHQNRSHGCRDMAILRFSKWRPSAILDFEIRVGAVNGAILHQCTKFRKDRSNRCGDVTIFVIFQYSGRRHLGFSKILNFNGRSAVRIQYASLYQIALKLQRYGDLTVFFSKWQPSAILDLLGAYWDHPRRPLDVSIFVQNLVEIDVGVLIT